MDGEPVQPQEADPDKIPIKALGPVEAAWKTSNWPKNKIGRARVRKFNEKPICYYCDREHKKINRFTVDHVEPQSKGGKNGENLVLCCKSCNGDKRDYTPDQYMELCVKRAKRVMYANHPSRWHKFWHFVRLVRLWFSVGEGIR